MAANCPECGRFCANVTAIIRGGDHIAEVHGECRTHGDVDLSDREWWWEDFDHEEEGR